MKNIILMLIFGLIIMQTAFQEMRNESYILVLHHESNENWRPSLRYIQRQYYNDVINGYGFYDTQLPWNHKVYQNHEVIDFVWQIRV